MNLLRNYFAVLIVLHIGTYADAQESIFVNQKFSFVPGLFYVDNLDYSFLSVKGIKKVDIETCWYDYNYREDTVEIYEEISPVATVFFDRKGRQNRIIYEQTDTVIYGNFEGNQWGYRHVYGYNDSVFYDFDKKGRPIACRYTLTDTLFRVVYDEFGNRLAYNRATLSEWKYLKKQIQYFVQQDEDGASRKYEFSLNPKDTSFIKAHYTGWRKMSMGCDSTYIFFTQDKIGRPLWLREIYYDEDRVQTVESDFVHSKFQTVLKTINSESVQFNSKYVFDYGKRGELLECKFYQRENLMSSERYRYTFY